jgi:MFS family permease
MGRRYEYLTATPFWVDEAESSINALTILQHGYPVDHYLGIPIFENTLVKPWPGNREYEFKDSSYSDRGVAIYHGWLPLYSIAASLAISHIRPDTGESPPLHRSVQDFQARSRAARLPSVLYGGLFLVLCYIAGLALHGRDTAITALLVGAIHQTHIDLCIRARYYSATVALSVFVLLCIWLVVTKGAWKYYLLAAVAFVLLFFTHVVTFIAASATLVAVLPWLLKRDPESVKKLAVFGAIVAIGTIPWILTTGYLSGLRFVPPGRSLLTLDDLINFPLARPVYLAAFAVFLALLMYSSRPGSRVPTRFTIPLEKCRPAIAILSLWIICGYAAFMLFMPAASFFRDRLNLAYWGPALLLASVFCGVVARIIAPRVSLVVAPMLGLLLLGITGHPMKAEPSPVSGGLTWENLSTLVSYIDGTPLTPNARLYAAPNFHLTLSFYTGRPFQSIAPIRKSFLDAYSGEILYIEWGSFRPHDGDLSPQDLKRLAACQGKRLSDAEAQQLSRCLRTREYREEVNRRLGFPGDVEELPPFARAAFNKTQQNAGYDWQVLPILRGFQVNNWSAGWPLFFYRFSNPLSRIGPNLNYAARLSGATATVLTDEGWVIYRSDLAPTRPSEAVRFQLLP